jgi:hypothetical protein
MTKEEIIQKMQNGDGQNSASNIQGIFAEFGLNVSSIQNAKFVEGVVYQNGEVKVGDKVVATNAVTYIRTMGKVSTSKMGSPQAALVSLDNTGKFMYAVMTPCGNPVTGTPVEPPKQSIVCDALKVDIIDTKARKVSATVTGSANNTTISAFKIDFGDGTVANTQTAEHTYAKDGTYKIVGHVTGLVDGKEVTVSSTNCELTVTYGQKPEVCPYNPNLPKDSPDCVEELPKTGAEGVVGLMAGVSILGAIGHRFWTIRRMQ